MSRGREVFSLCPGRFSLLTAGTSRQRVVEYRHFYGGNCPLRRKLNDPDVELSLFEQHQYNGKLAHIL